MSGIYHSPDTTGTQMFFEENRWNKFETHVAQLDVAAVLSTQALIMQLLKKRSRSVLHGERRHGFAALNNIHSKQDEFYDGSTEEYLVARVQKVAYDQWHMRVRFRENELSETEKRISYFEDYTFDWLRNGNTQAWHAQHKLDTSEEIAQETWQYMGPISIDMLDTLHGRINEHMIKADAAPTLHRSLAMQALNDHPTQE